MPYPMTRLCDRFRWKEFNSHSSTSSAWSNKCVKRWRKRIRKCIADASRFTDAIYMTLTLGTLQLKRENGSFVSN